MARLLLGAAALTAFAYVALCALLFVLQRSIIYYPQPRGPALPGTTALTLDAGGGARVEVTVRPSPSSESGAPAVLYFGGNAEAVAYSLPELANNPNLDFESGTLSPWEGAGDVSVLDTDYGMHFAAASERRFAFISSGAGAGAGRRARGR